MRCVGFAIALAVVGALVPGCGAEQDTTGTESLRPPNVVIILVDTLRADRIAGERNGKPIMPFVGGLAQQSWNFNAAIAQATWTKPSVVSLWTSLYPETHQVQFGLQNELLEGQDMTVQPLHPHLKPIAEYFKEADYATFGIQTNNHLTHRQGFDRGFDEYAVLGAARAEEVTSKAIDMLDSSDGPVFLYAHYIDPHGPYEPPKPYDTHFGPLPEVTETDAAILVTDSFNAYYQQRLLHDLHLGDAPDMGDLSEKGRDYIRQMYDGECRYIDAEVERLVQRVRQLDGATIIVFTSDHGEEFWEHGALGHAKTVYQELCNVPLFIQLPGEAPRDIDTPVELIDVLPTLAAYLDFAPNPQWQGRSLFPAARTDLPARPAYTYTRGSLQIFDLYKEAVIDGHTKLMEDHKLPATALFDLKEDPDEMQNQAPENPAGVEAMRTLLKGHTETNYDHPLASMATEDTVLSDEDKNALEAIGYLGDTFQLETDEEKEENPEEE